jgi:hypothetical protein
MVRGSDPFGSNAPDTLPGAFTQNMRARLTDSTRQAFREPTFSARRDFQVTGLAGYPRFLSARKAVDDSGDFRPCRNTQAGGRRSGSERAADSRMRNRASACPAVPAVA